MTLFTIFREQRDSSALLALLFFRLRARSHEADLFGRATLAPDPICEGDRGLRDVFFSLFFLPPLRLCQCSFKHDEFLKRATKRREFEVKEAAWTLFSGSHGKAVLAFFVALSLSAAND